MKVAISARARCMRRLPDHRAGVSELQVFSALHAAAVEVAGEPLSAYRGNDYAAASARATAEGSACGSRAALHPYLGPAYRGYFCRQLPGDQRGRKPTDAQLKAWAIVTESPGDRSAHRKPGVVVRTFHAVDEHYRAQAGLRFPHHSPRCALQLMSFHTSISSGDDTLWR